MKWQSRLPQHPLNSKEKKHKQETNLTLDSHHTATA